MQLNLYTTSLTIFVVMDSLGNIPVFLSILQHVDPKRRTYIILRESIFALITLTAFLLVGKSIMHGLQLSDPALSISGAIILFIIALRLIFPSDKQKDINPTSEPFLVPLAIPLFAGPASMAVVMLLADKDPTHISSVFLAILIAWTLSTLILLTSTRLGKILGPKGITAVERLTGMLLTSVAVQMFLTGIGSFFHLTT